MAKERTNEDEYREKYLCVPTDGCCSSNEKNRKCEICLVDLGGSSMNCVDCTFNPAYQNYQKEVKQ